MRRGRLVAVLALLGAPACSQILSADFDDLLPLADAGGGTAGVGGSGGDAGPDSSAGTGGVAGTAGSSGTGGRGGSSGAEGGAGKGGTAGSSGSAGSDAGDGGDGGPQCTFGRRDAGAVSGAASAVVINELQGYTDLPFYDYVELLNTGAEPVDLSGYKVGDFEPAADGGIIPCADEFALFPAGTVIPPGEFVIILANQSGRSGPSCCLSNVGPCYTAQFGISTSGDRVFLCSPGGGVVTEAEFPPKGDINGVPDGMSLGRFPDGSGGFTVTLRTPAAPNRLPPDQ